MNTYYFKADCSEGCEKNDKVLAIQHYVGVILPTIHRDAMRVVDETRGSVRVPFFCPLCEAMRTFIITVDETEEISDLTVEP